jgi:hypothetical protein
MFMLVDAQERDSFRAFMQFMIDHWDVAEPSLPRTWLYVHVPNVATSDGAGFGIPCSWDPVPEDSRWNSLYWGWRVMRTAELATTFPDLMHHAGDLYSQWESLIDRDQVGE